MSARTFDPQLRTLPLGSVPHTDPQRACQLIFEHFDIPNWPQLPRRTFRENMYAQFSDRFPGIVVDSHQERLWVDRTQELDPALEALYTAYIEDDLSYGELTPQCALGLSVFLEQVTRLQPPPPYVKGQVTGPVSWGLTVVDQDRRPVLYDEILADAIARHLRLKARWQERALGLVGEHTILAIDEPYLASFGSAYVALDRLQVSEWLEEVLSGIQGLKMVHCCGNTDWSILLQTSLDILSFDAYDYAVSVSLYPEELGAFLERGGTLAWGITPKTPAAYEETVASLIERFLSGIELLVDKGIHRDDVLRASLITPSCGLGPLPEDLAEHICNLTAGVSQAMRERYA